jgi:Uri superfamily endonuclease
MCKLVTREALRLLHVDHVLCVVRVGVMMIFEQRATCAVALPFNNGVRKEVSNE